MINRAMEVYEQRALVRAQQQFRDAYSWATEEELLVLWAAKGEDDRYPELKHNPEGIAYWPSGAVQSMLLNGRGHSDVVRASLVGWKDWLKAAIKCGLLEWTQIPNSRDHIEAVTTGPNWKEASQALAAKLKINRGDEQNGN